MYLALAKVLGGLLEVVKFAGVGGKRLRPANGQPVEDFHWELDLIHSGAICEQVVAERGARHIRVANLFIMDAEEE